MSLLAYVAHRNGIGQYGENIADAMSADTDVNNRNAPFRYVATMQRNNAAAAIDIAQAKLNAEYPDDPKYGHRWSVVKVANSVGEVVVSADEGDD